MNEVDIGSKDAEGPQDSQHVSLVAFLFWIQPPG